MAKQPAWFKMWLRDKPLVDVMPDASVGKAIKAALNYCTTGEVAELEIHELALFSMLKAHVDEAHSDYQRSVENGKKGGRPKATVKEDEKPRVTSPNLGLSPLTDGDGEKDKEKDIEKEGDGGGLGGEEPKDGKYWKRVLDERSGEA